MITAVILILLLAPASTYFYNQHQEAKKVQEINQQQFNLLKCIGNCSIIHSGNKSAFNQECLTLCNTLAKPSKEYPEKQLIKDPIYTSCTKKINLTDTATLEKYQNCLINIIPTLKIKYSYLN